MRWRKIGKIFCPDNVKLPHNCIGFSQAPQALVLNDRVRIYFTARQIENETGKYLGRVCYADFNRHLTQCLGVSSHEVLPLGKPGCFDEHGIFPLHVAKVRGRLLGYISGVNRRISVPVDGAIGVAESLDQGETFHRIGDGPVVSPSIYEPCIAVDPFVFFAEGVYHMWYVFGVGWAAPTTHPEPDRIYKIGHAVSDDGLNWEKRNSKRTIPDRLNDMECQAMPTVARVGDRYHMLFCYREASDFRSNEARGYRIGHAVSEDLSHWVRDDGILTLDVSTAGWDSHMLCYPHMFWLNDQLYLLYNGNSFGRHGFGLAVLEGYSQSP